MNKPVTIETGHAAGTGDGWRDLTESTEDPKETDMTTDPTHVQALKQNERLITSLRAENGALWQEIADLRARNAELDILYAQVHAECTRTTRNLVDTQAKLGLSESAVVHLSMRGPTVKGARPTLVELAACAASANFVAAAKGTGSLVGRGASGASRLLLAVFSVPVAAACAVGRFLRRDAARTTLATIACLAGTTLLVALMAVFFAEERLQYMPQRESDAIQVPDPAPSPGMRAWWEQRLREVERKHAAEQATPVAHFRRVS